MLPKARPAAILPKACFPINEVNSQSTASSSAVFVLTGTNLGAGWLLTSSQLISAAWSLLSHVQNQQQVHQFCTINTMQANFAGSDLPHDMHILSHSSPNQAMARCMHALHMSDSQSATLQHRTGLLLLFTDRGLTFKKWVHLDILQIFSTCSKPGIVAITMLLERTATFAMLTQAEHEYARHQHVH